MHPPNHLTLRPSNVLIKQFPDVPLPRSLCPDMPLSYFVHISLRPDLPSISLLVQIFSFQFFFFCPDLPLSSFWSPDVIRSKLIVWTVRKSILIRYLIPGIPLWHKKNLITGPCYSVLLNIDGDISAVRPSRLFWEKMSAEAEFGTVDGHVVRPREATPGLTHRGGIPHSGARHWSGAPRHRLLPSDGRCQPK